MSMIQFYEKLYSFSFFIPILVYQKMRYLVLRGSDGAG